MKTLVSLPHTTPSVSLDKLRKANVLYMPSTSSQGGAEDTEEEVDLNEVITTPMFYFDNLSLEKIQVMQHALHRKTKQE